MCKSLIRSWELICTSKHNRKRNGKTIRIRIAGQGESAPNYSTKTCPGMGVATGLYQPRQSAADS
jgi:hypothetical protein